jgi:hypothetical protein
MEAEILAVDNRNVKPHISSGGGVYPIIHQPHEETETETETLAHEPPHLRLQTINFNHQNHPVIMQIHTPTVLVNSTQQCWKCPFCKEMSSPGRACSKCGRYMSTQFAALSAALKMGRERVHRLEADK